MTDLMQTPVTLSLLLINVVFSLYVLQRRPAWLVALALRPTRILHHHEYYRLLTAGFLHANGAHLLINMLTLYFFGPVLERYLGPLRYLILYLGADAAAQGLTLLLQRANPHYMAVGASGAITGLVFAFCLYAPFQPLYLFFAIPIPALLFAIGFVALSMYAMRQRQPGRQGGLAHEAHLGGALGGIVITLLIDPTAWGRFLQQLGS
ncbi:MULTISPECIES: rhomboid family intramembrane serine protease [Modicisalibacter]|uniref:Rhomboid family intramembrane serine protease n=1 Tax=Modicisalibacter tunisiensis TaxID=390637 RepID=A0ABS7X2N8_9GAMM|nr:MULTISPECIES: rhomboid family intramembrane serine protease [Modicisalibacter]KXS39036.1 MAG: Rhomboid family protein [Halomonadaceae bacterium T82-2]MBZ9538407.1 rhomboid family intramembrane serine protease [Modicisalibacter tunisiensis]MBZ9568181.1 rhomboid family intramembrane serine protease [Modicisalibacter tunisiensis]